MQSWGWRAAPPAVVLALVVLVLGALGLRVAVPPADAAPAVGRAGAPGMVAGLPAMEAADAAARAPAEQGGVRLEQVGFHPLNGNGLNADVWVHRGVAYVGTWAAGSDRLRGCPGTGVKVVDLHDPARPELLGSLAEHPGTSAEVMRVRRVNTPRFEGDLLAVGLQACGGAGLRGVDLWDVTTPAAPQRLGFLAVGHGGVHELDLVQRPDGRVLALLTVPFSESSQPDREGDLRIVEVTDPRNPRALADWGARRALGLGQEEGQGTDASVYAHGAHASPDGMRAYVAYWDAGVMILDLADPAAPRLLGRTTFGPGDQGNAHSTHLFPNGTVLVQADEVMETEESALRVDGPPSLAGLLAAGGGLPAPPWPDTRSVSGEVVYLGRGCPAGDWTAQLGVQGARVEVADTYPRSPAGKIALLDRGTCPFLTKVERAKGEGAIGAIIVNTADGPLSPSSAQGPVGAVGIGRADGERLKAALGAGQTVTVTLAADLKGHHDFGGLRFWDVSDPAQPRALGTYHTPTRAGRPRPRAGRARRVLGPQRRGARRPAVRRLVLRRRTGARRPRPGQRCRAGRLDPPG